MKYRIMIFLILMISGVVVNSCKKKIENKVSSNEIYREKNRPQFHFSPPSKWMNDPNGMVYHNGEYHLFYQYYPDSTVWGPMHWGHAVSKDLVYWEHLPIALYPDSLGYIFSGSAVIDKNNTAGFGKDAMIAIFTHHDIKGEKSGEIDFQHQSIAYSTDNGRTFIKYDKNPVIKNPGIKDFRDPKVIWHEASQKWVLTLAAYDRVLFYNSSDLKSWILSGEFGIKGDTRLWECPDLFKMKVNGSHEEKWILITSIQKEAPNGGTATSYFVGNFDGKKFTPETKQKWIDYGKDNYAMVTWNNIPSDRTLAIGWMSNWQYAQQVPTDVWRSANTLPRELFLLKEYNSYTLASLPVRELDKLQSNTKNIKPTTIDNNLLLNEDIKTIKLSLSAKKPKEKNLTIRFSNNENEYTDVIYNPQDNTYGIDRTNSGIVEFNSDFQGIHTAKRMNIKSDTIKMTIYLDYSSIELFADGGRIVITDIVFPNAPYHKAEIIYNEEPLEIYEAVVSEIKNIW